MQVEAGTLWTIGHSTRTWEEFVALLQENRIASVADVRRFAGSRRNPQYSPDAMAPALAEAGIDYLPMPAAVKDLVRKSWTKVTGPDGKPVYR